MVGSKAATGRRRREEERGDRAVTGREKENATATGSRAATGEEEERERVDASGRVKLENLKIA